MKPLLVVCRWFVGTVRVGSPDVLVEYPDYYSAMALYRDRIRQKMLLRIWYKEGRRRICKWNPQRKKPLWW
jgi:hypothetical protein